MDYKRMSRFDLMAYLGYETRASFRRDLKTLCSDPQISILMPYEKVVGKQFFSAKYVKLIIEQL